MPWKETGVMDQRIEFVVATREPGRNLAEVCRRFGISRKTGYKWLARYGEAGQLSDLAEQSRRPRHSPQALDEALIAQVVHARERYGWGGKKLAVVLAREGVHVSAASIDRIIQRQGLAHKPKTRPAVKRFQREAPNELWQMDFKGEYWLATGQRIVPLTLVDDHSRFLVGLYGLVDQQATSVEAALIDCWQRHGLPHAVLCDHGTPWWSTTNAMGLTWLAVRMIQQDIRLLHGAFAHPQTQGKVERFHRTLEAAVQHSGLPATPEAFNVQLQDIRQTYNEVRPHEALAMTPPAQHYVKSERAYQARPSPYEYPPGGELRRLNTQGCLDYRNQRYFVTEALAEQDVWCRRLDDQLLVCYRHMYIRQIDLATRRGKAILTTQPPGTDP